MQTYMGISSKKRALAPNYVSPKQLVLEGFESPFEKKLLENNRWVVLGKLIPWDEICSIYYKQVKKSATGRPPLNARIVLGALIIKHLCNLSDQETVDQISENMYMQYFLGYTSFKQTPPFDSSLFVEFRKRIGLESINVINEKIISLKTSFEQENGKKDIKKDDNDEKADDGDTPVKNKGRIIYDATACPQDITYPTDLKILNESREKSEQLIDKLYDKELHKAKPRTYRKVARKRFLKTAQKKTKTRKDLRKAIRMQLGCVRRNIASIHYLLDYYEKIPFTELDYKYWLVINTVYDQQNQMFKSKTHRVEDRIVSIHQPHVRPIVRGKDQAKVEFGSKIHVSIINGISFLDELSWDAFNEGSHMMMYVEKYYLRFGFYPAELLADQIYCTRENRAALKEKGINLLSKPLGRPSAVQNHVSPGERNPIEGKFGQAKTGYGLNRIKARLRETSETWIACIFLVLNLVKLAGAALHLSLLKRQSFSVWKEIFSNKILFLTNIFNTQKCHYKISALILVNNNF